MHTRQRNRGPFHGIACALALAVLTAAGAARAEERAARPEIAIPKLAKPPTVDGVLTDGEWDRAVALTGFISPTGPFSGVMVPFESKIYLGHDATHFYMAVRCALPPGGKPSMTYRRRDQPVYMDSYQLELWLTPPVRGQLTAYQMIGNAYGAIYDVKQVPDLGAITAGWNANWNFKNSFKQGEYWTAELAVPFADFGEAAIKPDEFVKRIVNQAGKPHYLCYFFNGMMYFEGHRAKAFQALFPGEWQLDPPTGWFHLTTTESYQDFFAFHMDLWFKHWVINGLYFDECYLAVEEHRAVAEVRPDPLVDGAGRGGDGNRLAGRQTFGWVWMHDSVSEYHTSARGRPLAALRASWGIAADDVSFIPYWENAKYFKTSDPKVIVSAWTRPGGKVHCLVMNLHYENEKKTESTVTLDPKALGLKDGYTVYDLESQPELVEWETRLREADRLRTIDEAANKDAIGKLTANAWDIVREIKYDTTVWQKSGIYGSIRYDNTDHVEAAFSGHCWHFHSHMLDLVVGDGNAQEPYLLAWRFRDGVFEGPKVLAWHRGSFHTQQLHVHPCVHTNGTKVLYTADPQGYGQVFIVDVPEWDALPDRAKVTKNKEV